MGDSPAATTRFDDSEHDVYTVNLTPPVPVPTTGSADPTHVWLCLDVSGDTASATAVATCSCCGA